MKYALYHVNRISGEKIRYPKDYFPAMSQQEAESWARMSRMSDASSNTADEWETHALEEVEETNS